MRSMRDVIEIRVQQVRLGSTYNSMLTYIPVSFLFSFKKGFGLGLKIGLGLGLGLVLGFGFGIGNIIGGAVEHTFL